MTNIIDSIQLSGTVYTLSAQTSSGITSGEVQTMIDESISGKVDTNTYTAYTSSTDSQISNLNTDLTLKPDYFYRLLNTDDVGFTYYGNDSYLGELKLFEVGSGLSMDYSGDTRVLSSTGGSSIEVSSAITSGDTNAVAGGAVYDKFDEVEQVTARALNQLSEADEVTARALIDLNTKIDSSISGKVDTSAVTTSVTSASTDSQIPTAKAVYDAIPTGGSASYSAGRGIDITNDEISFNLPISGGSGTDSIAEGYETYADGNSSHAEGSYTEASGDYSHAEGSDTNAGGDYSHAEGYETYADGNSSHAEGSYTEASGDYSHAEGSDTNAGGRYSHAEGDSTEANGDCSHAEGDRTNANGDCSHAEGSYTNAYGDTSHAEGDWTEANGDCSHAEGSYTEASGNYSHAEGYETITLNDAEHASGEYNNSVSASTTFGHSGNTLFSVGNGTASNARHNAFEIRQNGDIYITSGGTDILLQDNLGSSIEVSSAITSGDTNPVEGGVLYDELRVGTPAQDVVLEWEQSDGGESTNYPSGCTKLTVEVDENEMTSGGYTLYNDNYDCFGGFQIESNNGVITVTTDDCESNPSTSITYSISGNVVTIEYPTITSVTIIGTSYDNFWTFKAIIEGDVKSLKEYTFDKFDEVEQVTARALNQLSEGQEVTARALIDLNDKIEQTSEAVSSKADASDVEVISGNVQALSAEVETIIISGGGVTSGIVQTMIDESVSGKLDTSVFQAYSGSVNTELGNKQDASGMTAYTQNTAFTAHTSDTNVHVTSQEKQTWNNKSDFSGDYDDLTNKPTIPTVPTNVSDFTNDAQYATSGYVDSAVSGKVNISDNNVSAFSGVQLAIAENTYYDDKNIRTIYIKSIGRTQYTDATLCLVRFGNSHNTTSFALSGSTSGDIMNGGTITAYTINDPRITHSLSDGVISVTFNDSSYYLQNVENVAKDIGIYYTKGGYSSGQTADVVENTVYDVLTELGENLVNNNNNNNIDISNFVTLDTAQDITGNKTFIGSSNTNQKPIIFKQANNSHKIGFVCQNSASTYNELATFEFRPNTYTDSSSVSHPLLYLGHYRNTNTANNGIVQTMVGFRQYDQKGAAAYHYLMPLPAEAKTPFSLTTSFKNYFAPLGFKNGSTMITTDNTGVADFSTVLGGLKLVKLTQSEYDALTTKDDNTVYFIGDSTNGYTMKIGSANVN